MIDLPSTQQAQPLCVLSHTPALPRDAVTLRPCAVLDAAGGAVAALAAQQRVVAESVSLALVAGRPDRLRGADAAPRHLVAQSAAALARCNVAQQHEKKKRQALYS